jgi:hypothetical protein
MLRRVVIEPPVLSLAVLALGVGFVLLVIWVAAIQRGQQRLRRRLRRVTQSDGALDLDEVLAREAERAERTGTHVQELDRALRDLEQSLRRSVQRVGVVRFNPFPDTGGDQSFAIALLDGHGDGVVLSSLHARADTRVFAKQVRAGRSEHTLSEEEQEAIRRASTGEGERG